jgi:hypothetical protein
VRRLRIAFGVILIAVGAVWVLQGIGLLEGSFMTGSSLWLWIGLACAAVGASVLLTGRRSARP